MMDRFVEVTPELRRRLTTVQTYWGRYERKRLPWGPEAIVSYVAEKEERYRFVDTGIALWRTTGAVEETSAGYEATERLVVSVPTVFAYVHPIWREGPEVEGKADTDVRA
jgi:hypothetical protein